MFESLFPSHWTTLKKLMWLKLKGASAVWSTVTGNPVSFTAKAAPLKQLEVAFSPVQDLNGYDAPWPAGGGKNKLQNPASTQTINGVTFTVNSDGTVSLSGTATANAFFYLWGTDVNYVDIGVPEGDYILTGGSLTAQIVLARTGKSTIYNAESPTNVTMESTDTCRMMILAVNGVNHNGTIVKPMMRLSSVSDATFAPYSNECPILGWDSLNVYDDPLYAGVIEWNQTVQNGNFANGYTGWGVQGLAYSAADNAVTFTWTTSTNHVYWQDNISFTVGHKYLLSFRYKDNGTHVRITPRLGSTTNFTTRVDATGDNVWHEWAEIKNLDSAPNLNRVSFYIGALDDDDTFSATGVMLFDLTEMFGAGNEPATVEEFKALFPKDYYAYNAGTETLVGTVNGMDTRSISISLGQAVYSGTVDVVTGVGEITGVAELQTVGAVKLRTIPYNATYPNTAYYRINTSYAYKSDTVVLGNIGMLYSNAVLAAQSGGIGYALSTGTGTGQYLHTIIPMEEGDTAQTIDTRYFGYNPVVYYELLDPIPIQLTPQEVESLAGDNTMWSNANLPITVTYRQN